MIDTRAIRLRWDADGSKRDERGKRLFAASAARAAGWGGVAAVAEITGLARSRSIRGLKDFDGPALEPTTCRLRLDPYPQKSGFSARGTLASLWS